MLRRMYILVIGLLSCMAGHAAAQTLPSPPDSVSQASPQAVNPTPPPSSPASSSPTNTSSASGPAAPLVPDSSGDFWGRFQPRATYRYEAADSIGRNNGLSSFQAFVPFWEPNSLQGLAFVDARFLLFDDASTPGTNVGLGFRSVVPGMNRTVGGHVSYDLADTKINTFHQVSGGFESLGNVLDARANFYAPLGRQKRLYGSSFSPNNEALFQGQYLMFGGGTQSNFYEYALSGFDTEVGGRVVQFGRVDLRAFVGTYYFGVDNGPDTWGGRARVEARFSDTVALNLSVQRDKLFDTTVNLHVSLSWPTLSGRRRTERMDSVLQPSERLGESIERVSNIVVTRGVERVVVPRDVALDPLTGTPLTFIHVAPGGNSDGSFESPYSSLEKAFHDPRFAAGNVVVYDRTQGTYSGSVTLAQGTRLVSAAVQQSIDTLNGGRIALPFSGASVASLGMPHIQGTVFVGNNSAISGFHLSNSSGGDLITQAPGSIVRNVRVENNVLNGGNIGVNLYNVAGSAVVANNKVQGAAMTGVNVQVQHDEQASIRITDNTVGGSGLNGIYTTVNDVLGMSARVDSCIERNQVSNSGGSGISIAAGSNSRLHVMVKDNQVSNATMSGIEVFTGPGNSATRAEVMNNVVLGSGLAGGGGIMLGAQAHLGRPTLSASVLNNQLIDNFTSSFTAAVHGRENSLLLELRGNNASSVNAPIGFILDRQQGLLQVVDMLNLGSNNTGKIDVTSAPVSNLPKLP